MERMLKEYTPKAILCQQSRFWFSRAKTCGIQRLNIKRDVQFSHTILVQAVIRLIGQDGNILRQRVR